MLQSQSPEHEFLCWSWNSRWISRWWIVNSFATVLLKRWSQPFLEIDVRTEGFQCWSVCRRFWSQPISWFLGVGTQNAGTRDKRVESGCHSHKCDSNQAHCMKRSSTSLNIHEYSIKSMRAPWHPARFAQCQGRVDDPEKAWPRSTKRDSLEGSTCGLALHAAIMLQWSEMSQIITTCYNPSQRPIYVYISYIYIRINIYLYIIYTMDETRPNHQTMSSKFST